MGPSTAGTANTAVFISFIGFKIIQNCHFLLFKYSSAAVELYLDRLFSFLSIIFKSNTYINSKSS